MASPLEAIIVRFGAEWTGGAAVNRVVSDINRIVATGKQAGDMLSMTKMLTGIESHDKAIANSAVTLGQWQANLKMVHASINSIGTELATGAITQEEAASRYLQLGRAAKEIGQEINNAVPAVKGFGASLAGAMPYIVAVGAAIGIAAKGFQEWREAAEMGAVIRQTGESFDFLSKNIYQVPDLLNQMREASRGTISDMQLMSSFMTLVAGTTPELGSALAAATPQLLEIAKAANTLNPTLGDTTFFFESLARGIKRSEIRLIDNLGLNLRIGEANKRWAEQLGKTVQELTAEERQLAILNETLRVGGQLIDQVGGKTDSLIDPYLRLAASSENVKNGFREIASVTFSPVISSLAWLNEGLAAVFIQANDTYNALRMMQQLNAAKFTGPIDLGGGQTAEVLAYTRAIQDLIRAYDDLGILEVKSKNFVRESIIQTMMSAVGPIDNVTNAQQASAQATADWTAAFGQLNPKFQNFIETWARQDSNITASVGAVKTAFEQMFGSSVKFFSARGGEYAEIIVGNDRIVVSLHEIAQAYEEIRIARARALFDPGLEGVTGDADRNIGVDLDPPVSVIREWTDEAKKAAIAAANFNPFDPSASNQEALWRVAGEHIQKILDDGQAALDKAKEATDETARKIAEEFAAVRAAQSQMWMNMFAGGNFNSELVVGDIRNIGSAWVTTSSATAEQAEKLAELNKEMEAARDKLWDLENGIGVQGDKAESTAEKISDLNAEIANYESVIAGIQQGITTSSSQQDFGLNVNNLEAYKQFITMMGEWNAPVDQLAAVAQGLGLISPAAADAMLKMTLLQGAMDNLNFKLKTGQIDASEIPEAIQGVIAAIEQDKTYSEIVLDLQVKAQVHADQVKVQQQLAKSAIRDEYGNVIDIGVGADLTAAEKSMLGWLGMVEGEKPTVQVEADDKAARDTLNTLTSDIEKANPILSIYGKYIPDPSAPTGTPSGSGGSVPGIPYQPFATGGYIAGQRGRERVIRAHAGEFVLRPEAVDRLGLGFLSALNRGSIGSQSNSVTVQSNFYAPVGSSEVREVVLRSADDGAKQIGDLLARGGYKLR